MTPRSLYLLLAVGLAPLALAAADAPALASAPASGYRVLKSLPLPGKGGWDLLKADSIGQRLYLTHGDEVLVVDTAADKLAGAIHHLHGAHGIALLRDMDRGYITEGQSDDVAVFNLRTLAVTQRIKVGRKPDVIIDDPKTSWLWAFNAESGSASVLRPGDAGLVATLDLGGQPEFAVADGAGHVFVNLEDKNQILRIDSVGLTITARWDLAPGEGPSSLSFDPENDRLFVGCHNHLALVVDSDSGTVVAHLPIGDHVDGSAYDADRQLLFHACGDGTLSVIHQEGPDQYRALAPVLTKPGARTLALDSQTHRLYLPTADLGPAPAPSAEHPHPWPQPLPGTFSLLVVGKE